MGKMPPRDLLGNHRRQAQQGRMELRLGSQSLIVRGRTIWIADAHRDDGKRFVVHADEKLTAFMEPESVFH